MVSDMLTSLLIPSADNQVGNVDGFSCTAFNSTGSEGGILKKYQRFTVLNVYYGFLGDYS